MNGILSLSIPDRCAQASAAVNRELAHEVTDVQGLEITPGSHSQGQNRDLKPSLSGHESHFQLFEQEKLRQTPPKKLEKCLLSQPPVQQDGAGVSSVCETERELWGSFAFLVEGTNMAASLPAPFLLPIMEV